MGNLNCFQSANPCPPPPHPSPVNTRKYPDTPHPHKYRKQSIPLHQLPNPNTFTPQEFQQEILMAGLNPTQQQHHQEVYSVQRLKNKYVNVYY